MDQPTITREQFEAAKTWRLNFGKHKGKTLNEVAIDDDGLLYLDWLLGQENFQNPQNEYQDRMREAFSAFLLYDPVARDVSAAIEAKNRKGRGRD